MAEFMFQNVAYRATVYRTGKLRGGEYDKRKTDLRVTKFTKKVGENHVTMWPNSLWNRQFQSLKLSHLTRNLLNVLISQTKILENIS